MVQKLWYIRTMKQTSISSPKKQVGCFSQKMTFSNHGCIGLNQNKAVSL